MKNVAFLFVAVGLAACSDSSGGGSGGAGGIQDAEDTSTTTGSGEGGTGATGTTTSTTTSGGACGRGAETDAICDAVAICESGDAGDCLAELDEERCANPSCTAAYDGWLACVGDLVESGAWDQCPDYPVACDAEREAYDICTCGADFIVDEVCDFVEACEPGGGVSCREELTAERCVGVPGCIDLFDAWSTCVDELAINEAWDVCPDYPTECDAQRSAYEAQCAN